MDLQEPMLDSLLRYQLLGQAMRCVGDFHIAGSAFHYTLYDPAVAEWLFSVYAWVSTREGGTVIRVGRSEGMLRQRLAAYKRSLERAMSGKLGPTAFLKGDTQPWEAAGWRHYAEAPYVGLIFARPVKPEMPRETRRQALTRVERALIAAYDPPLSGVSAAGRRAKRAWEETHGPLRGVRWREAA